MQPEPSLHLYVEFLFGADPILASEQGGERGHPRLGDIGPDAIAEQDQARRRLLAAALARPLAPAGITVSRRSHWR